MVFASHPPVVFVRIVEGISHFHPSSQFAQAHELTQGF